MTTILAAALAGLTVFSGAAGVPESRSAELQTTRTSTVVSCTAGSGLKEYHGSARLELTQTGNTVTAAVTGYQMGTNEQKKANVNVKLYANGSTYSGHSADDKRMDDVWRDGNVASRSTTRTNGKPLGAAVEFVFDAPIVSDPECIVHGSF